MREEDYSIYMRRCLDLAVKAEGMTYPNPMVGAVVVHNNMIIGEGYHRAAGSPHAEVNAISSVKEKHLLKDSILFVSLEPCSHFGKTPPCTDLIISSGIPFVVTGTRDTSEKVNGKGIEQLKRAGIKVVCGVLESECRRVNRRFFSFHEKKRPYITLKWAQSADGFIDIVRPQNSTPEPYWITGKAERVLVHIWRSQEEAILAGGETIRRDRPKLNVRYWSGNSPLRVILSRSGEVGDLSEENETKNLIFTFNNKKNPRKDCEYIVLKEGDMPAQKICEVLYAKGISSLLIEGGALVHEMFIKAGLWDEARIFTGSRIFGSGKKAPRIDGVRADEFSFEQVTLKLVMNNTGTGLQINPEKINFEFV